MLYFPGLFIQVTSYDNLEHRLAIMSNKLSPLSNSTSALLEFWIWSDAKSTQCYSLSCALNDTKLAWAGLNWPQPTKVDTYLILRCKYNVPTWGGKFHYLATQFKCWSKLQDSKSPQLLKTSNLFVFFEVTRKWCKTFWSSLGVTSVYNKYSTLLLTFSAQYIHVLSETKINFLSRDRQISAFWIFLNNSPCKGFFKNCVISETVILRWLKVTLKGTMSKRQGNDFPQSTF